MKIKFFGNVINSLTFENFVIIRKGKGDNRKSLNGLTIDTRNNR